MPVRHKQLSPTARRLKRALAERIYRRANWGCCSVSHWLCLQIAEDIALSIDRSYIQRLDRARAVIRLAENWADKQRMPVDRLCIAALKDVRRALK